MVSNDSKMNIEVFTDFDGTLSMEDTGVLLIDDPRCMGTEKRKHLEEKILNHEIAYRDAVYEMWDNVTLTWEEAWDEYLNKCRVDPGFPGFYEYCKKKGFPITVVSSGMRPVIHKVLVKYMGKDADDIEIVANNGKIEGRKWEILYIDDTPYGNDKSKTLERAREKAPKNTIFVFCGDGVSDISAARNADVLFARNGRDLVTYCNRHDIPYIGFDTFEEIEKVVADLAEGRVKLERDQETGFCKVISVTK
ncbi:HAD-like domain-containing protein [Mycotypha africana]|uniref:HAD-like domain-containing protein n=1 Tax=Mycotypha africana TaxID=64632 RepID=UPI0023006F00|nr:HAD-like domain-containing protein [Mycotypha africana]KAI8977059.1 HAD-like domain-containing protein [Mycotypha africana]